MMRDKRRYILVRCTKSIEERDRKIFERSLYSELAKEIGEIEYHIANPKVMKYIGADCLILRVGLEKYEASIAALALIKNINGSGVGLFTLKSSGTIKALQKSTKD